MKLELITFGNKQQEVFRGQDLWKFLGVKTPYKAWVIRKIKGGNLVEGEDYQTTLKVIENDLGGRPGIDHYFTKKAAIIIATLEGSNNRKRLEGLISNAPKPCGEINDSKSNLLVVTAYIHNLTPVELLTRELENAQKFLRLEGSKEESLEARKFVEKLYSVSLSDFDVKENIDKPIQERILLTPTMIGQKLGGIRPRKINLALMDMGFQTREIDHVMWTITEEGKKHGEMLKTNFLQWRWYPEVVDMVREFVIG